MSDLAAAIRRQEFLPRYLCHLHQRLNSKRLNLVIGAGASIDAKVPAWEMLLERLANKTPELTADIKGHKDAGLNPEYLGQIIYHRYRDACALNLEPELKDLTVKLEWATSIYEALYKDLATTDIDHIIDEHPYLGVLRDLTRRVSLTINFNFDDLLSEAIARQIERSNGDGSALSVVWQPPLTERSNYSIIYHVNGVLPRVSLKKRSPQLVFTEDSFADAVARDPGINSEYIFLRFVQNTMFLIGHSLNDSSLKNYLRRNRDKSPANHHYYIHWIPNDDALTASMRKDIFEANLELYNLITMFLTSEEIREFIYILNQDERKVRDFIEGLGGDNLSRYFYYIVGPVAAGKSSLLEQLRCFETYEEWTRPPPAIMYLSFEKLDASQQEEVNEFVYSETKEKNRRLHLAAVGIHFMDRGPLDLYAFSKDDAERQAKTRKLKEKIVRYEPLQSGQILFITAKGPQLVARNLGRGRKPEEAGDAAYYDSQSDSLRSIYEPAICIKSDKLTIGQIARNVARHALIGKYQPIDLVSKMDRYE